MIGIRIKPETREIIFVAPTVIPPRDARAALHRLLDEALDSFAGTPPPAEETAERPSAE